MAGRKVLFFITSLVGVVVCIYYCDVVVCIYYCDETKTLLMIFISNIFLSTFVFRQYVCHHRASEKEMNAKYPWHLLQLVSVFSPREDMPQVAPLHFSSSLHAILIMRL